MKEKGFTLVELLAVIAIIGILSLVVVPSVVKIYRNINSRILNQKKEYIVSAAELYGSNNPDIFGGSDVAYVYVYELLEGGYLDKDKNSGDSGCTGDHATNGCMMNPVTGESMNERWVELTKKTVGIVGKYVDVEDSESEIASGSSETLVKKVCDSIKNGKFKCMANSGSSTIEVTCNSDQSGLTGGATACVLVSGDGSGDIDNYLKYGSNEANWRVLGLYMVSDAKCTWNNCNYQLGDVNMDGEITEKDKQVVVNYNNHTAELTNDQIKLADVNDDGTVNANDVTAFTSFLSNGTGFVYSTEKKLSAKIITNNVVQ